MATPALMFEEALTPIKGWFDEAALDIEGTLSADVEYAVPGGRVLHVNAVNAVGKKQVPEFKTGVEGTAMAIFAIQASDAFDVSNPGVTAKGNFVHQAIAPTGIMSGLVATGAYELQTTEFDTTNTYAPNDLLTAEDDDIDRTVGGLLSNENAGGTPLTVPWAGGGTTHAICGVVSRGVFNNEHGVSALHFWPVYLPGTT